MEFHISPAQMTEAYQSEDVQSYLHFVHLGATERQPKCPYMNRITNRSGESSHTIYCPNSNKRHPSMRLTMPTHNGTSVQPFLRGSSVLRVLEPPKFCTLEGSI